MGDADPLEDASLHFVRWRPPHLSQNTLGEEVSSYLPVTLLSGGYLAVGNGEPFAFFFDSNGIPTQRWVHFELEWETSQTRILAANENEALLETCDENDRSCRFVSLAGFERLPTVFEHSEIFDGDDRPVIAARGIEPKNFLVLGHGELVRIRRNGEKRWSFSTKSDGLIASPSGNFCLTAGNGLRCYRSKSESVLILDRGAENLVITDYLIVAAEHLGEDNAFFRVYDWRGELMTSLDGAAAPPSFHLVGKYLALRPAGTVDWFIYKLDSNQLVLKRRFQNACEEDTNCAYHFNAYGETLELHTVAQDDESLEITGELVDLQEETISSFSRTFDPEILPTISQNVSSGFLNTDVFLLHDSVTGHLMLLDVMRFLPSQLEDPTCLPVTEFRGEPEMIQRCDIHGETFGTYEICKTGEAALGFLPVCVECEQFSLPVCDGDRLATMDACGNLAASEACSEGYRCESGRCIVPPLD